MPTIEQNLASILAAKYGRDVRQAIHDSIGQNYSDVSTSKTLAEDATDAANDAATLANTKAGLANSAATLANTKAGLADSAATLANTKAGLADSAATADNGAATLANTKAGLADAKAGLADSAATLANTKAGLADSAATAANAAAQEALDNIIISAAFSSNNIDFTKADSSVVTLYNAKTELRGDRGYTGLNLQANSDALIFAGSEDSALAQSIQISFDAILGASYYNITLSNVIGLPTGMSYALTSNPSTSPKVTFTSTESMVSPYGLISITATTSVGNRIFKIPYVIAFRGHAFVYEDFTQEQLLAIKGDTGNSAVEVSTTEPTDPDILVWVDTDETYELDTQKWAAVDIVATQLAAGSLPTASISQNQTGTHIQVDIPTITNDDIAAMETSLEGYCQNYIDTVILGGSS